MTTPSKVEIREGLTRLSGLSPAVQAILPRLSDDEFDAGELSGMVGQDPVLAARVLRLANSPFYGLPRQVGSLQEAVLILGFSNMRGLVLSSGLIGAFSDAEATACSLAAGAAAGSLARSLKLEVGQAFTAGLLHNLGSLLLGHFAPTHWQTLVSEPCEGVEIRLAKERQIFGYDHCELAAEIAGQWRFPATIQSAIRRYPRPPDDPAEALTDLVHAAWVIGGAGQVGNCLAIAPEILGRLGLEGAEGQIALVEATQAAIRSHGAGL